MGAHCNDIRNRVCRFGRLVAGHWRRGHDHTDGRALRIVRRCTPTHGRTFMSAPHDIAEYAPTPTQRGMILQAIAAPDSPVNVEQFVVRVQGGFDPDRFAAAWRRLIERHETLRARYSWQVDGSARCIIQDSAPLSVQVHDARDWSAAEIDAFVETDFHTPIGLSAAPMFRFACLNLGDDEWRLLWSFHHLVMDGRSVVLAIDEFFAHYDAFA